LNIDPELPPSFSQVTIKPNTTVLQDVLHAPRVSADSIDRFTDLPDVLDSTVGTSAVEHVDTVALLSEATGFALDSLPSANAEMLGIKDPVGALEKTRDLFAEQYGVYFHFTPKYAMVNESGQFMDAGQLRSFNSLYAKLYSEGVFQT
jgi:hypothetical protein